MGQTQDIVKKQYRAESQFKLSLLKSTAVALFYSLIRYIIKMVPYHANDDLKSFNQISKSEYFLLRQGLGEYFLIYQSRY